MQETTIPKRVRNEEINIEFNPNLFNNIYWHIQDAFADQTKRYLWIYGGSSASKTYSVVQALLFRMLEGERENALVMRKYAVDIKDSIYSDFEAIIDDWGLRNLFVLHQNYIRCIATGSFIRFRGLDDPEKVKGITKFKRIILEEVSQFEEADLKQIRKRLRGQAGQQIIGIFNPISEDHWIKVKILDQEALSEVETNVWNDLAEGTIPIAGMWVNEKGNLVIMKTNYLDNKYIVGPNFIDQHVIDDFEEDRIKDNNSFQIYGLGNWGKLRTGGEFWKDFNIAVNTAKVVWDEEKPISLTFDENIHPYLTCLVWQIIGKKAIQIDEICLEDPNNRVINVCREFINRYPQARVKGLFIYGDSTSIKEDTKLEKGENFFTKIEEYLADYRPSLRVAKTNPSVVQSAGFINGIFSGRIDSVEIIIGDNNSKSIFDYQYALENSDGTLKKTPKKKHPVTGITYEEFGHISDAMRYLITVAFALEYEEYLRGGKRIRINTGTNTSRNSW